jgi:hypothetical protein
MGASKTVMRNSDGVGNVIFDYESLTAQEYAAKGEIVIAALQVRRVSRMGAWVETSVITTIER